MTRAPLELPGTESSLRRPTPRPHRLTGARPRGDRSGLHRSIRVRPAGRGGPAAVLDGRTRMRDGRGGLVAGLRVIDAGAMPVIVSGCRVAETRVEVPDEPAAEAPAAG